MSGIHPTAIVDPGATIHPSATIGPYCVVRGDVLIEADVVLDAHVVVEGPTRLGAGNRVFPFAVLGAAPQSWDYHEERTRLDVGEGNIIREYVTMNRGTIAGSGITRVGRNSMFMAHAHVAHDCLVGDAVTLANSVALAGHVVVEDHAVLGGLAAVHQFARIGAYALVGGGAMVAQDVPPYTLAQGDRARLVGLNRVGLQRGDFSPRAIAALKTVFRWLFRSGSKREAALARAEEAFPDVEEVQHLIAFVRTSRRGVCRVR